MPVDFGLAQIFPLADETTGAEPKVVSASFADPYLLLIRDDEKITLLRVDESGDLDEVEQDPSLQEKNFRSGSLYDDIKGFFRLESELETEDDAGTVLMFLLTVEGGLQVTTRPSDIGLYFWLVFAISDKVHRFTPYQASNNVCTRRTV